MKFNIRSFKDKFNKIFLRDAAIVLALMIITFFITEKEVSTSVSGLFIRKCIACALVIYITQITTKTRFFHKRWLSALFMIVWWYSFVFFKFLVMNYHDESRIYDDEIFVGTYSAASFIMLQYFAEKYGNKVFFIFTDLLKLTLISVPMVTVVHYLVYGYPIIYDEMLAVYNTSIRETVEWINIYLGYFSCILIIAAILGIVWGLNKLQGLLINKYKDENIPRNKYLIIFVMVAVSYYPWFTLLYTDWVKDYVLAVSYSNDIKYYTSEADTWYDNINLATDKKISDKPHTVIMVIGESAGRDYMHVYNKSFSYANTPWLESCMDNEDFIVFNNVYGCYSLTQQVLENVLTEKSQYNDKKFLKSMNIVDIMKKRGYKTYWITNMGGVNSASTFSLIASRSDEILLEENPYDNAMLKRLSDINTAENNFIVLHGNGSHASYKSRYPANKEIFHDNTVESEYSNAINFIDEFLKDVYDYGVKNLNMQVMLYVSDHGENLHTGHGPSDHSFDKVRIPMFIYFSKDYQKEHKEKFDILVSRKNSFYTNDMIYNTLSGIVNAESNYYNPAEDLSSEKYNYTVDNLLTFDKAVKVSKDPFLK